MKASGIIGSLEIKKPCVLMQEVHWSFPIHFFLVLKLKLRNFLEKTFQHIANNFYISRLVRKERTE